MPRLLGLVALVGAGCVAGPPGPAPLDTATEACRSCRMAVSNARLAAQVVASGEEAVFFDDLACLAAYLEGQASISERVVYVADHRTAAWVAAAGAIYTRALHVQTPMGGGVIAHADAASREADPAGLGGTDVPVSTLLPRLASTGGAR